MKKKLSELLKQYEKQLPEVNQEGIKEAETKEQTTEAEEVKEEKEEIENGLFNR